MHLFEDLGTLLHHQSLLVGVSGDVALMLQAGRAGAGVVREKSKSCKPRNKAKGWEAGPLPAASLELP